MNDASEIKMGKGEKDGEFNYGRGAVCGDRRGGHLSRQGKEEGAEMYRLSCLRALWYFPGDMPVSRLNTVIK